MDISQEVKVGDALMVVTNEWKSYPRGTVGTVRRLGSHPLRHLPAAFVEVTTKDGQYIPESCWLLQSGLVKVVECDPTPYEIEYAIRDVTSWISRP